MPTLLSINNYYYRRGGAEAVFLDHNELFESHDWRVVPFSMRHPDNLPTRWSEYFADEIELGEAYGPVEKLHKAAKTVFSFEARRRVRELIEATRPVIAHAHNIYHHLSPSILQPISAAGVPVVLTLHDLKIACPAYRMMTHDGICERCRDGRLLNVLRHRCIHGSVALSGLVWLEAAVHRLLGSYRRHVTRFAVPSRFYLEKFVDWGWPREMFDYLPNAVDVGGLEPDFQPGRAFVYFGRLSPEKGVATLIRAAARAGVGLRIAGTGPQEEELRALAATTGCRAEFLGYCSGSALHDVVRSARAVVLPSEWYENAPISALEAFAFGKPLIGAAIGGIPELIEEGGTGFSFAAFSDEALADVLDRVSCQRDAELEALGRSARAYVEKEFSRTAYYERCRSLYENLAGSVVPAGSGA